MSFLVNLFHFHYQRSKAEKIRWGTWVMQVTTDAPCLSNLTVSLLAAKVGSILHVKFHSDSSLCLYRTFCTAMDTMQPMPKPIHIFSTLSDSHNPQQIMFDKIFLDMVLLKLIDYRLI